MKIFIIGSCSHLEPDKQNDFKQACEELGGALAIRKHTLIVCSGNEFMADPHIIRGANKVRGRKKVLVYRPDKETITQDSDEPLDPYQDINYYSNIKFTKRVCQGGWRVVHLQALAKCDAVLAIGGNQRGTGTVLYSADVLGKPLIPILSFDGATRQAWRDFKHYYSEDDCNRLEEPWSEKQDWGWKTVDLIQAIAKKNPFKTIKAGKSTLKMIAGLLALAAWIGLFLGQLPWIANWPFLSVVLMFVFASILGSLLRSTLYDLGLVQREWYTKNIFLEIITSLIIAFAIFLVSQISSFLLNGQAIKVEELEDIQRVGILLSILCLFAALFIENAWQRLFEVWRRFIGS